MQKMTAGSEEKGETQRRQILPLFFPFHTHSHGTPTADSKKAF